ncbi:hypothetical protein B0H21DRAFT_774332, partial [Amylocystis lapponica]
MLRPQGHICVLEASTLFGMLTIIAIRMEIHVFKPPIFRQGFLMCKAGFCSVLIEMRNRMYDRARRLLNQSVKYTVQCPLSEADGSWMFTHMFESYYIGYEKDYQKKNARTQPCHIL